MQKQPVCVNVVAVHIKLNCNCLYYCFVHTLFTDMLIQKETYYASLFLGGNPRC